MSAHDQAPSVKRHDEWISSQVEAASAAVRYLLQREIRAVERAIAAADMRTAGEHEAMAEDLRRLRALLDHIEASRSRVRRAGPHLFHPGW